MSAIGWFVTVNLLILAPAACLAESNLHNSPASSISIGAVGVDWNKLAMTAVFPSPFNQVKLVILIRRKLTTLRPSRE